MASFAQDVRPAPAERIPSSQSLNRCGVHDHLCLLYGSREEQFATVIPFMKIGLERGERCIYVADENTPAEILAALERDGVDASGAIARGDLSVVTKQETYLRNGDFDPDAMIEYLGESIETAQSDGYPVIRITGEMTWALDGNPATLERLIEYECKANELLRREKVVAICQYNRNRFGPETLLRIIHSHSLLAMREMVCENPHYIPAESFANIRNDPGAEVQRLLDGIVQTIQLKSNLASEAEALRESEGRYRQLLQALPVAVYTTDADGRITLFNEAAREFAGREATIGEDRWCVTYRLYRADGSFLPHDECPMAVTLRSGTSQSGIEAIAERPDGTRAWFMPYPTPVQDETGRVTGGINVLVDITQRKLAEALLIEQKRVLELIATGCPVDDCLLALTTVAARLLPNSRAAVVMADEAREKIERAVASEIPEAFGKAIEGAGIGELAIGTCGLAMFAGAVVVSSDFAMDERWSKPWRELCLAHGMRSGFSTPVFSADKKAIGSFFIASAVAHEPDEWARSIGQFGAHLAGIAIDRKLAEDRQRQAEDALRRSEKFAAAGRMAATIAHEINNPLEAIVNIVYLLAEEGLSSPGQEMLKTLDTELCRVAHITKQTLEFYRDGKMPRSIEIIDPINDAIELFARKADQRGARIQTRYREAGKLFGFPGELRQVFANLIGNALEAGATMIRIHVASGEERLRPARRGVRVTFADNGSGIAPEFAGNVFEPFFTTKEEKGTGLGLWVSKGIVQKHEGWIRMRTCTRAGRSGTLFTLFLPAEEETMVAVRKAS